MAGEVRTAPSTLMALAQQLRALTWQDIDLEHASFTPPSRRRLEHLASETIGSDSSIPAPEQFSFDQPPPSDQSRSSCPTLPAPPQQKKKRRPPFSAVAVCSSVSWYHSPLILRPQRDTFNTEPAETSANCLNLRPLRNRCVVRHPSHEAVDHSPVNIRYDGLVILLPIRGTEGRVVSLGQLL